MLKREVSLLYKKAESNMVEKFNEQSFNDTGSGLFFRSKVAAQFVILKSMKSPVEMNSLVEIIFLFRLVCWEEKLEVLQMRPIVEFYCFFGTIV